MRSLLLLLCLATHCVVAFAPDALSALEHCPRGSWCDASGQQHACPAGVANPLVGQTSPAACSVPCAAGHFCPPGSASSQERACGAGHFCPPGSALPQPITAGYYGVGSGAVVGDEGAFVDISMRVAQALCPRGHYCEGGASAPTPCSAGYFNALEGSSVPLSCAPCEAGYVCRSVASTSGRAQTCGNASVFCTPGSSAPQAAAPGYFTLRLEPGVDLAGDTSVANSDSLLGEAIAAVAAAAVARGDAAALASAGASSLLAPHSVATGGAPAGPPLRGAASSGLEGVAFVDTPPSAAWGAFVLPVGPPPLSPVPPRSAALLHPAGEWARLLPEEHPWVPGADFAAERARSAGTAAGVGARVAAATAGAPEAAAGPAALRAAAGAWPPPLPPPVLVGHRAVANAVTSAAADPATRNSQAACLYGYYCAGGVAAPCPRGVFGSSRGLSSPACSGPCPPGYACPLAAALPSPCGASAVYCPGATDALAVPVGYYSVALAASSRTASSIATTAATASGVLSAAGGTSKLPPHVAADYVLMRFPAAATTAEGVPPAALRGSVGPVVAPTSYAASLVAAAEQHAIDAAMAQLPMGAYVCTTCDPALGFGNSFDPSAPPNATYNVAFNSSSSGVLIECSFVSTAGTDATGSASLLALQNETAVDEQAGAAGAELGDAVLPCTPGTTCAGGVARPCAAGRYSSRWREADPACQGPCARGFWCPSGAVRPLQRPCGNESVFCPLGSGAPLRVASGFYSTSGLGAGATPLSCAAAYSESGLAWPGAARSELPGSPCAAAPADAAPAPGPAPVEILTGTIPGSAETVVLGTGLATSNAPPDTTCSVSRPALDAAPVVVPFPPPARNRACVGGMLGGPATRSAQAACEAGAFCVDGLRFECPPGRWGSVVGETRPSCEGECEAGWACPWASVSATMQACTDPAYYCPAGSGVPVPADKGFMTVPLGVEEATRLGAAAAGYSGRGGASVASRWGATRDPPLLPHAEVPNSTVLRSGQVPCPAGHWCSGGVAQPCPAGRWAAPLTYTSQCTGDCAPGFFCPAGVAASPTHAPCGSAAVYCPAGSGAPVPVSEGFFSTGSVRAVGLPENATQSAQAACTPGSYCTHGVQRQCPGGVFGSSFSLASPNCSGPCAAGHFCPPGSASSTASRCGDAYVMLVDVLSSVPVQAALAATATHPLVPNSDSIPMVDPAFSADRLLAIYAALLEGGNAVPSGFGGAAESGAWTSTIVLPLSPLVQPTVSASSSGSTSVSPSSTTRPGTFSSTPSGTAASSPSHANPSLSGSASSAATINGTAPVTESAALSVSPSASSSSSNSLSQSESPSTTASESASALLALISPSASSSASPSPSASGSSSYSALPSIATFSSTPSASWSPPTNLTALSRLPEGIYSASVTLALQYSSRLLTLSSLVPPAYLADVTLANLYAQAGGNGVTLQVSGPSVVGGPLNFSATIPWRSGVRFRLPALTVPAESFAKTQSALLSGGPSAVYCPVGSEWPVPAPAGAVSTTSRAARAAALAAAAAAAAELATASAALHDMPVAPPLPLSTSPPPSTVSAAQSPLPTGTVGSIPSASASASSSGSASPSRSVSVSASASTSASPSPCGSASLSSSVSPDGSSAATVTVGAPSPPPSSTSTRSLSSTPTRSLSSTPTPTPTPSPSSYLLEAQVLNVSDAYAAACDFGATWLGYTNFTELAEELLWEAAQAIAANLTADTAAPAPPGWYALAGIGYPCPPGTFGARPGMASRAGCSTCPAGSACPLGSSAPAPCPDGAYASAGSPSCTSCPAHGIDRAVPSAMVDPVSLFEARRQWPNRAEGVPGEAGLPAAPVVTRCKTARRCCGL